MVEQMYQNLRQAFVLTAQNLLMRALAIGRGNCKVACDHQNEAHISGLPNAILVWSELLLLGSLEEGHHPRDSL